MGRADGAVLKRLILPVGVFIASLIYFAHRLSDEPYFIDEGAYLVQTYYYRLVKEGRVNDVDWFHQASYDHLQVGRLLAGLSLDLHGYKLPTSIEGMERWWGDDQTPAQNGPPEDRGRLLAARWPMVFGGAFGCTMIYLVGRMLVGPVTGIFAAALLAASPVYFTHARRAMADDWVQALTLGGFACAISLAAHSSSRPWRIPSWCASASGAGVFFGLAAATKLNGVIGSLVLVASAILIAAYAFLSRSPGRPPFRSLTMWLIGLVLAIMVATTTFIGIHPYFYARPELLSSQSDSSNPVIIISDVPRSREWIEKQVRPIASRTIPGRLESMLEYRQLVLDKAARGEILREASLPSIPTRAWAILNQGIGRWSVASRLGPPPSTAWIPLAVLVTFGLIWCVGHGRWQWATGQIPSAWMVALWPTIETVVLLRDLSLDWDRYYLGVVAWTCLFAAVGIGGTSASIAKRMVLAPPSNLKPAPGIANAN